MDRIAWITVPTGKTKRITGMIEKADGEILNITSQHENRCTISCLLPADGRQEFFDNVQNEFTKKDDWRMIVQEAEAVIPAQDDEDEDDLVEDTNGKTREELLEDVSDGARLDIPTMMLMLVSAMVAGVGMIGDSVTVVIGAMVIAPLLGPILAAILGAALGERKLILKALRTAIVGFAIAVAVGVVCALLIDFETGIGQVSTRSDVGLEGAALALASGTAAALSVTTGVSAVLVGVMVSAALLPPAVAIGLFLGQGHLYLASGATLLFFVNVSALTLAGQVVFLVQGIRPRQWFDRKEAAQSAHISIAFWAIALVILVAVDYGRDLLIGK